MWYDPIRMTHQHYKGRNSHRAYWPAGTPETMALERRYDNVDWIKTKETMIKVLKWIAVAATAVASFLAGLQF